MNIEPRKVLDAVMVIPDSETCSFARSNQDKIRLLARIGDLQFLDILPPSRILLKGVWKLGEFGLDLQGAIDFRAERERLQKELERIKIDIDKVVKKINSQEFIARAPESVVAENKTRHAELLARLGRVESNLANLPPG